MNWLKKLKLAFPMVETPSASSYFDVGRYFPPESESVSMLWFIDNNLNLKTKKVTSGDTVHSDWKDFIRTTGKSTSKNILAQGRSEKKDNQIVLSLVFGDGFFDLSPEEKVGYRRAIINILDENFDNPRIMVMD
jgi:hypothetical protein